MNELASGIAIVQARIAKKEYDVALIKLSGYLPSSLISALFGIYLETSTILKRNMKKH